MIGAVNVTSVLIAQLGARDEDIGLATGLINSVRALGGAVGVAIYSSLLANRVAGSYARDIGKALLAAGLPASSLTLFLSEFGGAMSIWWMTLTCVVAGLPLGDVTQVPGATPAVIEAGLEAQKSVYVDAFQLIYCVTVAFGGKATHEKLCVNID